MSRYLAGIIGNFLEHYDHALFGFLAPFFAPYFFPDSDPLQALIYTYALLPLGIISRPLGAILFGWMGDRIGTKKTLLLTLIGMALATALMGFLPVSSPLLWSLFRLLQNFFAAGEVTGGALYILEGARKEERSLWSSFFDASGILGILVASGAAFLSLSWGISWRWLFWAGALTAAVGIPLRALHEKEEKRAPASPFPVLWAYKKEIGTIASASGFSYANYYMLSTFLNGFLPLVSSITVEQAIAMNTLLLLADFFFLPIFGWIGSKIGKERLMWTASLIAIGTAIPLFLLLENARFSTALIVRLSMTCIGVAFAATYHAWSLEVAPPNHRYLVGAVGSVIGSRLIGAPAPAIALYLYQKTGLAEMASLPVLLSALLASLVLFRRQKLKMAQQFPPAIFLV